MSSSPVAPVTVAPVAQTAAGLRAQILGAAETELIALLGAVQDPEPPAPRTTATTTAPANPVTRAVDTARTTAAGQQASLAPLFADLVETLSSPNLPAPIRAAIAQVLALRLPADDSISPQDVRQAIAQSGLFLEADLAAPGRPPPPDLKAALLALKQALPAPAPPQPQTPAPAATSAQAAPAAPTGQAVTTSPEGSAPVTVVDSSTHPAVAPTAPAETAQAQTLPASPAVVLSDEPTQALARPAPPIASETAAGQAPPPATPATPASGPAPAPVLGQEASAPSRPPPATTPPSVAAQPPAPLDPKTALLTLQQAPPERPTGDSPAAPAPRDLRAALLNFQQAAREPAAADAPPQALRPAPPTRDAALSPQAPAAATLPEHAELSALVEHLAPQVEQALARLTLHQLASLPDGASSAWMFEVPLATPQGTAMAQFEVERDGAGSGGGDAPAPWRARFSIDIEPLGPVHVHLAMSGGKAAVSVWAERADSLAWLRGQGAELAGALPAEVVFRAGAPGGVAAPRGHFLDQTS